MVLRTHTVRFFINSDKIREHLLQIVKSRDGASQEKRYDSFKRHFSLYSTSCVNVICESYDGSKTRNGSLPPYHSSLRILLP